ncbi:MAG: hypothetical protein QW057_04960 [Candidatus Bathyarchaeia archaeon]
MALSNCFGCGNCVAVCRRHALALIGGSAQMINLRLCEGCRQCFGACPNGSVAVVLNDRSHARHAWVRARSRYVE